MVTEMSPDVSQAFADFTTPATTGTWLCLRMTAAAAASAILSSLLGELEPGAGF